jgi:hypothetical protein
MFPVVSDTLSTREQGDIGERAAIVWLLSRPGACVFVPLAPTPIS